MQHQPGTKSPPGGSCLGYSTAGFASLPTQPCLVNKQRCKWHFCPQYPGATRAAAPSGPGAEELLALPAHPSGPEQGQLLRTPSTGEVCRDREIQLSSMRPLGGTQRSSTAMKSAETAQGGSVWGYRSPAMVAGADQAVRAH